MERAWREHRKFVRSTAPNARNGCHHLLLVYAVECGLKAALMRRRNAQDIDGLGPTNFSHDLREGIKHLRVPAGDLPIHDVQTRSSTRQETVPPLRLHEAFRYWVPLNDADEVKVISQLGKVLDWLDEELR